MTRINVVPVAELRDIHLVAEHYEIPDIFKLVRRHLRAGRSLDDVRDRIPETYRYGTGHQSFFLDKLGYLLTRHTDIKREMQKRGIKVSSWDLLSSVYPEVGPEWYGTYEPTVDAAEINRALIAERLEDMRARGMNV